MPFLFVCHSEHTKQPHNPSQKHCMHGSLYFIYDSRAISIWKIYGKVLTYMYIFIAVQAIQWNSRQFWALVLQQATDMKNSSYFSKSMGRFATDHQRQEAIFKPFRFNRAVYLHQKRLVQLFPKALLHRLRCVPVKKKQLRLKTQPRRWNCSGVLSIFICGLSRSSPQLFPDRLALQSLHIEVVCTGGHDEERNDRHVAVVDLQCEGQTMIMIGVL